MSAKLISDDIKQHTAVVAIDFGTSRSGYEQLYIINLSEFKNYSTMVIIFRRYSYAYTAKPDRIWPNKTWPQALPEGKTLTEILLGKDHSFIAFGYLLQSYCLFYMRHDGIFFEEKRYTARDKFIACDNQDDYLYFSNFKMVLHNKVKCIWGKRRGARGRAGEEIGGRILFCTYSYFVLNLGRITAEYYKGHEL